VQAELARVGPSAIVMRSPAPLSDIRQIKKHGRPLQLS
jgi:hypothetical protein